MTKQLHIERISPLTRNQNGLVCNGIAHFSDGKKWKFGAFPNGWVKFTHGNSSRWFSPPKRIAAFNNYFKTHCRCCLSETDEREAACIHCGKLKPHTAAE